MIDVVNPIDQQVVGQVVDMAPDQVRKHVDQARQAQGPWAQMAVRDRVAVVRDLRVALVARRSQLRQVMMAEAGRTFEDVQGELLQMVEAIRWWESAAEDLLADQALPASSRVIPGRQAVQVRHPHGVVGVIGPWNYPLTLTLGDAVPALLAGNTVVIKPSEVTPLSSLLAAEVMADVLAARSAPEGVLQVVTGLGAAGAALVDEVDMVQFTGSVGTGRRVAHACVDRDIPYSLELGGKDPWIVLADADIPRAAAAATHYAMANGGQVCMSAERVYVEAAVHDQFVDEVAEIMRDLRVAPPVPRTHPGSYDLTPMIGPGQGDIVADHIADALDKGARAVVGGLADDPVRPAPTLLVDVDHSMTCMTDETFGPTLPVMRVHDADHAVALANDSAFGLTASIWTSDRRRGQALARRVRAATVSINDAQTHLVMGALPMGGVGASGTGARGGAEGIHKYTRSQVVVTNRSPLRRDPHWMPASPLLTKAFDATLGLLHRR